MEHRHQERDEQPRGTQYAMGVITVRRTSVRFVRDPTRHKGEETNFLYHMAVCRSQF